MTSAGQRFAAPSEPFKRHFNTALGGWFAYHGRRFPWRSTRNPYRVLVAEMLLRKTRAGDVVRVYRSITTRYPSLASMASADTRELANVIAPVGLPGRAVAMRNAARKVLTVHRARMPASRQALQALPGVGVYIANAVLCFAFGMRVPLVDSGVGRVLLRSVLCESKRERLTCADGVLWGVAERLLPRRGARLHNMALLDLAAGVCRPVRPLCGECPIRNVCRSKASVM